MKLDYCIDRVFIRLASGESVSKIAEDFGISRSGLGRFLKSKCPTQWQEVKGTKKIGLTQIQKMSNLYIKNNWTLAELASEFDCSIRTIEKKLIQNNIKRRPKGYLQGLCREGSRVEPSKIKSSTIDLLVNHCHYSGTSFILNF